MKKKILSFALAMTMLVSVSGCSQKIEETKPVQVSENTQEAKAEESAKADSQAAGGFYSKKTVELIVPWGAGGGADTATRLISSYVEKELDCTIVINNITGGGGSIGLNKLVSSSPDGLTYAYCANTDSNGNIMLEGVTYGIDDFAPVCKFAADPHIIVASNASGIKSMDDLIAKGDGNTLWGIGGAWTHWDFLKLEFEDATDTKYKRLVYDGGGAVITDVMSGDCTVATPFVSEALSAIEAGEAVGIAITGKERNKVCPDIPTVSELGIEGFDSTMWRGIVAPKGTDEALLQEFAKAFEAVCNNEEFLEAALKAGITIDFTGYEDFKEFFKKNHDAVKAYYEENKDM